MSDGFKLVMKMNNREVFQASCIKTTGYYGYYYVSLKQYINYTNTCAAHIIQPKNNKSCFLCF